ncbi:MAG: glycosyltransferase [Acidobacteriia bacterium]|nr:glycosyltransferase [Terriglobia bacterium]
MIWFYWISGILTTGLWLVAITQALLNLSRIADLTERHWLPGSDFKFPSLTIVSPGRNEQEALETALRSLARLDYPAFEVIAVNDRSTDRTGEIMERVAADASGRVRVVHVSELPAGWLGKTHAMWLGARQGAGDWILFTDADCIFDRTTLRRAVFYATQQGLDHLVVVPTAIMRLPGEKMMMGFLQTLFSLAHRPWKVADPKAKDYVGMGAFNLIRRSVYESIGTYERLRLEILDDMKLGEAVKKAGFRQNIALGPGLVRLRWAVGAMGVVRNLEKNLFAYLQFRVTLMLGACLGFFFLGIWPFLGLILAPGWSRAGFALGLLLCAGNFCWMARTAGVSPLFFLTYPLASALSAYAAARSAFVAIRDGGVTWRGTKYGLKELRKGSKIG